MQTTRKLVLGIMVLFILGLVSCEKETQESNNAIEGTYIGKLSTSNTLKSVLGDSIDEDATAVITMMDSSLIHLHCYGSQFDTTIQLNAYHYNDSIMVCLTDSNFVHTYGHMMGHGNGMMGNGMGMGGNHMAIDTTTAWGNHLWHDHKSGDMHFGGFSMMDKSFNYAFKMMDGHSIYYLHFKGTKK